MGKIGPLAAHEISDIILQLSLHVKIWWPKYRPAPKIDVVAQPMPSILAAFPAPKPNEKPMSEEGPFFLTKTIADRVIIEILCDYKVQDFFMSAPASLSAIPCFGCQYDYLTCAYAALCDTEKIFSVIQESNRGPITEEQKGIANHTIATLKGLIISYLTLLLQEPEGFGLPSTVDRSMVFAEIPKRVMYYAYPRVFINGGAKSAFPEAAGKEIMHKIIEFAGEDSRECLSKVVEGSLKAITNVALKVQTLDDIAVVDSMFADLLFHEGVPEVMVELPQWLGENPSSGSMLEATSILGVLFGMSCVNVRIPLFATVAKGFGNIETMNISELNSIKKGIYSRMENHHSQLLGFVKAFFKAPHTENALLSWMAAVLNSNAGRTKYNHDERTLSSYGLLFNLLSVLLMISQSLSTKVNNIQRSYLSNSKRLDLHNETRIATSLDEYLSVMGNSANAARIRTIAGSDAELNIKNDIDTEEIPNRHSECFFLTMRCFHLAFTCAVDEIKRLIEIYSRNKGNPAATKFLLVAAALGVYVESEHFLGLAGIFWSIFTRWALAIVCPPQKPDVEYSACVPLPKEVPLSFALIPESTICDIAVYVKQTASINKLLIPVNKIDDIMNFFVCIIASRSYVKEFAVRKNMLDALIRLIPTQKEATSLIIEDVFCSHQLSKMYIIPALIRFSADAEFTGSSSQYYDRFNYRMDAQQLFNHILEFPDYKKRFASYVASPDDPDVVTKFAKYLVNDINYMFEETLESVQRVQSLEKEMRTNAHSASDPTMNENIGESRRRVQSTMFMLTKNIEFLLRIIRISSAPYTASDSALRSVASMTIFSLQKLSMNSSSLLTLGNDRYDFNPVVLRNSISEVMANFAENDTFASFCAENAGFTDELIETTASLISTHGYYETKIATALRTLRDKVAGIRAAQDDDMDIEMDDVPDEYTDPISGDIMKDPVYLPSKNVVDRSTVNELLLNDPTDPFTRLPFTEKDVVPAPEIKEKIDAFIREYKANH